jgi:hypothetical protein
MKYFCPSCGKPTVYNLNIPKFCSECGVSFAPNKTAVASNLKKLFPSQTFAPAEAKPLSAEQNERINATIKKMAPKYEASISFENTTTSQPTEDQDIEYIDSEDFDASKFKSIKPQFKVEARRSDGVSFENLVTNGYVNNYKSSDSSLDNNIITNNRSADDILNEFQREAGTSRGASQD